MSEQQIEHWAIERLHPNLLNPRGPIDVTGLVDLATSIREQGVLVPLIVQPDGSVVAGHRRLAAAQAAGLDTVPVIVQELSATDQLLIMLLENLQRQNLNPIQEARGYQELLNWGLSVVEIARRVGYTPDRVRARLALLGLAPEALGLVEAGRLGIEVAGLLTTVVDPETQVLLAGALARRRATVEIAEKVITRSKQAPGLRRRHDLQLPDQVLARSNGKGRVSKLSQSDVAERLRKLVEGRTGLAADVARHALAVCTDCGMAKHTSICAECPLLRFADRWLRERQTRRPAVAPVG